MEAVLTRETPTMRRAGRMVRLRSASTQLPDPNYPWYWWWPCVKLKLAAWYAAWLFVFLLLLSFNNIVLIYTQTSLANSNIEKLPIDAQNVRDEQPRELPSYRGTDTRRRPLETGADRGPHFTSKPEVAITNRKFREPDANKEPEWLKKSVQTAQSSHAHESPIGLTPNEILQQSALILITSFDTHSKLSCQIQKFVEGFQNDDADVSIYLDKSAASDSVCSLNQVNCIELSVCTSPGCVNNALVKAAHRAGHEYLFVWDARFSYTDTLAHLAHRLVDSKAEIVSPCIHQLCNSTTGLIHIDSARVVTALPTIYLTRQHSKSSKSTCLFSHLLPPVMLSSSKTFLKYMWDFSINSGEHTDFLLTIRKYGVHSVVCNDLEVIYTNNCSKNEEDLVKLEKQWLYFPPEAFRKWNITSIYNGLGYHSARVNNSIRQNRSSWTSIQSSDINNDMIKTVIQNINDREPGWMNVRHKNVTETKMAYMITSPCTARINGTLNVEYDRHSSFKNKEHVINVNTHHINRSCPTFQQYWTTIQYGKSRRHHVYYVTAVSNDSEFMTRLLNLVNKQFEKHYTNIVIVDMGRPGQEQFNLSAFQLDIQAHYLYLGAPFSRSIGLRKGFDFAQNIAQTLGHEDPILFSLDTSMMIPPDFTRRVWKGTRCGVSTYAPMCYKKLRDSSDGYWVQYGYGMVGVCSSDYRRSGGWDTRWGYHWGAEDVDLIHRLQEYIPYTVRIREEEYYHKHSVENRNKVYYIKKNIYHNALPVIPETRKVEDNSLKTLLVNYALKTMKYPITLKLQSIYVTTLPQDAGVLYDLLFRNNINEDYYALIKSL